MADRGVGPYIQRRKLLMNSPRVYEKTLHFARADSTRKGHAASVRLLRRQRLREDVRPYNANS